MTPPLDRRTFLLGSGLTLSTLTQPAWTARGRTQSGDARGPLLVVLFLRGGLDGLSLIAPYGDPDYARRRPSIAIGRPSSPAGAIDLDGRFGLHPAAAPLAPLFERGDAVALHAVGSPQNTRSHFEEQDAWETALPERDLHTHGWLNRHLATTEGRGPIRAVAVGPHVPRSLRGDVPALAFRGSVSGVAGAAWPQSPRTIVQNSPITIWFTA